MSKTVKLRPSAVMPILLTAAMVLLAGCATGKTIRDASDVNDDGERNTMLISYDITLNVTDKYPTVSSTSLVFRCGEANRLGVVPECFELKLPLQGKRTVDGYNYFTFKSVGAKAVQMPYGVYEFTSVEHKVVVDVISRIHCQSHRRRRTLCQEIPTNITQRFETKIPQTMNVDNTPGSGCYAGELRLETNDGEIRDYSFDQDARGPDENVIAALPENIQVSVQDQVNRSCSANQNPNRESHGTDTSDA